MTNKNSNARRDGTYASFKPLYSIEQGGWEHMPSGWTKLRRVLKYNVLGQEVENQDALGITTSAKFGHNGSLAIAIARNAQVREIAFSSFETGEVDDCSNNQFNFNGLQITEAESHSGRRSALVSGPPIAATTEPNPCYLTEHCKTYIVPDFIHNTIQIGGTSTTPSPQITFEVLEGNVEFSSTGTFPHHSFSSIGDWIARVTVIVTRGCKFDYYQL